VGKKRYKRSVVNGVKKYCTICIMYVDYDVRWLGVTGAATRCATPFKKHAVDISYGHSRLQNRAPRPLHQLSKLRTVRCLHSPVLAATSQLVAIEADSALGPVTAGDWRTASNLFELGGRVHEARCILDSGHVNNRHSHCCPLLHGS